jgi:hypothetical protein
LITGVHVTFAKTENPAVQPDNPPLLAACRPPVWERSRQSRAGVWTVRPGSLCEYDDFKREGDYADCRSGYATEEEAVEAAKEYVDRLVTLIS